MSLKNYIIFYLMVFSLSCGKNNNDDSELKLSSSDNVTRETEDNTSKIQEFYDVLTESKIAKASGFQYADGGVLSIPITYGIIYVTTAAVAADSYFRVVECTGVNLQKAYFCNHDTYILGEATANKIVNLLSGFITLLKATPENLNQLLHEINTQTETGFEWLERKLRKILAEKKSAEKALSNRCQNNGQRPQRPENQDSNNRCEKSYFCSVKGGQGALERANQAKKDFIDTFDLKGNFCFIDEWDDGELIGRSRERFTNQQAQRENRWAGSRKFEYHAGNNPHLHTYLFKNGKCIANIHVQVGSGQSCQSLKKNLQNVIK